MSNPTDVEAELGSTVILNCVASGEPQPSVTWMLNSNEIGHNDSRITMSSEGSM